MSYKSLYYQRKVQHKCTECGKADLRTLSGKTICKRCTEKNRERKRLYALEYRADHREVTRTVVATCSYIRYHNRQENHECVTCGMKMPENWYYVRCEACRERQKAQREKEKTA